MFEKLHFTAADAPDIDGKIFIPGKKNLIVGTFIDVVVTDVLEYDLIAEESGN